MLNEAEEDSLSQTLEGVTLSPRRMSSQLENPLLEEGSPSGTDMQHTKTNLINKFNQEQSRSEYLQSFSAVPTGPPSINPSNPGLNSARKHLNSRYEAV